MPDKVEPIASVLQQHGYATHARIGNPTIRDDPGFSAASTPGPARENASSPPVDEVVDLLRSHAHEDTPFFLYLHLWGNHAAITVPETHRDLWRDEALEVPTRGLRAVDDRSSAESQ